ncbi:TOMM precursor leader peptide-binding protein [Nostoc sp. CMAA1605]|uniref:TOMM precursor leader peptide-binding protein n=1 Tax=Nostoc sp. CMAA1605 TaxID=2055159 RepID=UPI001F456899|nr:TOMM precursor leader peptide-binding protein [Nostoc sp. CMAA1605]MCF4965926.1 adenylate cyclase [Nostoc sp. CMAA1605]
MINQPKFKSCYTVETIEPDQVFIISERESICLSDRLSFLIASLIKEGKYSVDEIIDIIQLELLPTNPENSEFFQNVLNTSIKAQYALFHMEQRGYLEDESERSPLAIFCHHLNVPPIVAAQRLQSTTVAVQAFGSLPTDELISLLKSLDIQVGETGDITVVLTDDYLHPQLAAFNQQASSPWLLANPLGTIVWIGPIFHPQKTACWECLANRLRNNRPVASYLHRHKQISLSPPLGFLNATVQTAIGMIATEVFKWIIQGENSKLAGSLITYDTLTLQTQNHTVIQRPQCHTCGEPNHQPSPIVLESRQKTFTTDGGHRSCSPQETLKKYAHHISPITGIVRELSKIPGNGLTHTYIAKHHFQSLFDDLGSLRQNIGGRSAGKGRTDTQAQASGFCEAIERYSGVFQGDEIRLKSSYEQLGDKAIHPNDCMNFSPTQYQHREQWNVDCQGWFQKVPAPFDTTREIDWTPVWSLTHQEFKYLPTAYCYYGYPQSGERDCWADSNGCAAGNTLEEAILQGFMELVERDCVALWWYNRLPKHQVDLNSFDEPYFQTLNKYYESLDRQLWVIDITSDLNIPAFAAISRRTDGDVEDIILGYGVHFDAKLAISRALTEVNQILPNVLVTNADGSTQYPPSSDRLAVEWWKSANISNQPYLVPDAQSVPKVYADYPQLASDDLLEDVRLCQKIVEQHGLEMLVLDQTRPDIGLKVAKVIVPGMRHMWKRVGAGRLYDVPVKMGWLQQPLTEAQLNPYPMWM